MVKGDGMSDGINHGQKIAYCEVCEWPKGVCRCSLQSCRLALLKMSDLIAYIDRANDLHAMFTVKDSAVFADAKQAVAGAMK